MGDVTDLIYYIMDNVGKAHVLGLLIIAVTGFLVGFYRVFRGRD